MPEGYELAARVPREAGTGFRDIVEQIYYHGYVALNPIIHEMIQYHETGHAMFGDSQKLIEHLTLKLGGRLAHDDLHNSMSVLLADLIHKDGRAADGTPCDVALSMNWGTAAGEALRRLQKITLMGSNRIRPRTPVTGNELVRFISIYCPHLLEEFIRREPIPASLPLLDSLVSMLGPRRAFSGAIAIQHVLGSTVPLLSALTTNLLETGTVGVLGKPYSTNHATMWHLRQGGVQVHDFSWKYSGHEAFESEFEKAIENLLGQFVLENAVRPEGEARRFLLLDDGGKAISMLHRPRFRAYSRAFSCVEQTRRGAKLLRKIDLLTPVVNVAESYVKLEDESPMIAASVIHEVRKKLNELRQVGVEIESPAGVIGLGSIGAAVVAALQDDGWGVVGYDEQATTSPGQMQRAKSKEELFAACRLIIGCTGEQVLGLEDFAGLQNDTVLVSASSSDIEFSAWYLRAVSRQFSTKNWLIDANNLVFERVGAKLLLLGDLDHPCHMLHVVTWAGKRLYLVNGGFPVNFTGEVDPIAPQEIQLTRALLYGGCWQAASECEPGLIDLSDHVQAYVRGTYRTLHAPGAGA